MKMTTVEDIEKEQKKDLICTGNNEIDKQLGGGIPVRSLTLIEGESDAGKSVLAQQIMWGGLNSQHRVLLFTAENTVKSIDSQMESLGLSVIDSIILGWLKVFVMKPSQTKTMNTFAIIISTLKLFKNYDLVVVDSLTPFLAHAGMEQIIPYFEECKKLCDGGRTIINTAHTYAFDEQVLIRLRSACDAHFRLRIEEVGDRLVKVLEVSKVKGAVKTTGNVMSFDVDPGSGMRVMPIGRAKV
jgi:archaeal flagellar protein FlaH